MARDPYADPELAALSAHAHPRGRGRRVALTVGSVAAITFVAAFYVPLLRAHHALLAEHSRLAASEQGQDQALAKLRGELRSAQTKAAELAASGAEREAEARTASQRGSELRSALEKSLSDTDGGQLSFGTSARGIVVALSHKLMFAPKKLDVSKSGQGVLCAIAKATGGAKLRIGSVAGDSKTFAGAARKQFPDGWSRSAARAASITASLEERCGTSASRLEAVALGETGSPASAFPSKKPPAERVEIEVLTQ